MKKSPVEKPELTPQVAHDKLMEILRTISMSVAGHEKRIQVLEHAVEVLVGELRRLKEDDAPESSDLVN